VHKNPDAFVTDTQLSLSQGAVSHLWNHVTRRFRAWERASSLHAMAQTVWHAAHESTRVGGSASAAFHAFRPELLAQLERLQPRPATEIVILGAQHADNLGERVAEYDRPQTVRLRVLLESYANTYGQTEERLAAYELNDDDRPAQHLGYMPKDAPRRAGSYLAMLQRPEGKRRIEGELSPLKGYEERHAGQRDKPHISTKLDPLGCSAQTPQGSGYRIQGTGNKVPTEQDPWQHENRSGRASGRDERCREMRTARDCGGCTKIPLEGCE